MSPLRGQEQIMRYLRIAVDYTDRALRTIETVTDPPAELWQRARYWNAETTGILRVLHVLATENRGLFDSAILDEYYGFRERAYQNNLRLRALEMLHQSVPY